MSDVPPARAALLEAVTRRRRVPAALQVRENNKATLSEDVAHVFKGLQVEDLALQTEEPNPEATGDQAKQTWAPVRLVKEMQAVSSRLPVLVLLHATGYDKDSLAVRQAEFARRGYLAVTIDCRYHGDRSTSGASCRDGYEQALIRAWRGSGERPFLLDNVWDLLRLLDFLEERPDADASSIGMAGVSLGGMHTWFTAAVDERVAAAAPMIGVQHFGWAVENNMFHGRVSSIPLVFMAAMADLAAKLVREERQQQRGSVGGTEADAEAEAQVTAEVVSEVWNILLPGLSDYDAPQSLPLLAPRPLLIANGELDPRCPMKGVELALEAAREAYQRHDALDNLELYVVPGCEHECTDCMWERVAAFMDRHLKRGMAASKAAATMGLGQLEQPQALVQTG